MPPLEPFLIAGYDSGLRTNTKPFLIPTEAFATLDNAYVWRERVKKRECLEFFGRLRRVIPAPGVAGAGNYSTINGTNTLNVFGATGLDILAATVPEANAQLQPGSATSPIVIVIAATGQTLTDNAGTGTMTVAPAGTITAATINYSTGVISITASAVAGPGAVTLTLNYYPTLPVMGIWQRELTTENVEQTIFFDQKYAYTNPTGLDDAFQDISGVEWSGGDADFFSAVNYRGTNPFDRIFFVTNFFNNSAGPPIRDPIRYTQNGTTFTNFKPAVDGANFLIQARILVPYYGRLLALNVWEGTDYGPGNSSNYFNRCRFSQIGDPLAADAWQSDIFGKGGFIDAPVNEDIISATFHKNTLIVGFERSTWQLRYVGEYGLPFLWERISSDFGCESQYSAILFDEGVLQVGDRAITTSSAVGVQRIDLQIPDQVFQFRNDEFGNARVHGIRDFQKELVYWNWVDTDLERDTTWKFPNRTLLYNYRNKSYALFRENITCWGIYQSPIGVTWDRLDIFWDGKSGNSTLWDNENAIPQFPSIVAGNQQGFISYYAASSIEEPTLTITALDLTTTPVRVTSPNHNLADNEWIKITGALFTPSDSVASSINDRIFQIVVIDTNTIDISYWDGTTSVAYSNSSLSTYIGSGQITLLPKLTLETKDFNPYQQKGQQFKSSYVDFLVDATPQSIVSVNMIINSSPDVVGNLLVGNTKTDADPYIFGFITGATQANPCVITSPNHGLRTGQTVYISDVLGMTQLNNISYLVTYIDGNTFSINVDSSAFSAYVLSGNWRVQNESYYVPGSDYAWHRFYATTSGQFVRVQITYNDDLMSNPITHQTSWVMDAMTLWLRKGSRNIF